MSKVERYRLITEYPKDKFFDNKQVIMFDAYEVIRTLNQQESRISDLEAKLAESEEQVGMLEEHKFYADNIIQAYADKCKNYEQQLAEKEKEIETLNRVAENNKKVAMLVAAEKTKFAIAELEKVKEWVIEYAEFKGQSWTHTLNFINNQIKQLKEKGNE